MVASTMGKEIPLSESQMSVEEKFAILKSIGEECIHEDELKNLLDQNPQPICVDGFEPSGRMHIAQGLVKAINVKKLISSGCKVKIVIADWFALLNNKLGGDLRKIKVVGDYMIEIWKAMGINSEENVEFLWSSEEINSRAHEYWPLVLDIATKFTVPKILRCSQSMGCSEQDELTAAQIMYIIMQCADIFFLKADICQMGMDQKQVNMLAREYCEKIKRENKPILLSHHMIPGLQEGQEKMSMNDPSSCIFMEDEEAEVNIKIKKAYCPPNVIKGNPCLEYAKYIIFPWFDEFKVERNVENGGEKTYKNFEELASDYETGKLHPADLKPALSKALNIILQPVRDHFKNDQKAKELLKRVKGFKSFQEKTQRLTNLPPTESLPSKSVTIEVTKSQLSLKEKYNIVRSIGQECQKDTELENLLDKKPQPISYDGFEPSGRMHIAQGVVKAINVNKLTSAGCRVKILIADWFAQLNNKMGGDLEKIKVTGEYMIEIWKSVGLNLKQGNIEFLWSSEEINSRSNEYWLLVMDIARRNKLPRILRCCQIMGRSEQDELTAAQIFYPCMQCADIFFLKADICQLGMDQRKVNMLAREYCDDINRKNKPIILSHHMIPGLKEGQEKMSKSDPSSSIFMEDEEEDVNLKIKEAYCPVNVIKGNPCIEYAEYIVFPWFNEFKVERSVENGGEKIYKNFEELVIDYKNGKLHPVDLKPALSKAINIILQPVRDHFKNDENAKDLLNRVKGFKVTK